MAATVIYLSLALLLTPQTVVEATDLKAAAADTKSAATDLKAEAEPAATDLKAAAADLKTEAVDRCPPGVGQFLSLNGRQYQKEARILIKTRRKKGRLFIRICKSVNTVSRL